MNIPEPVMKFLNYRDRSTEEVRRYLRRKNIVSEAEIPAVIKKLEELGFANDTRFTENRIRYRIGNLYGPFYIQRELAGLGISAETFRPLLAELEPEFVDAARQYAAKIKRGLDGPRLEKRLLGRGFSTNQVKLALKT